MPARFAAAARALRSGRLVVYPTDTLFGLGARAEDPNAVHRLAEAKGRPGGLPLSVAVAAYEDVERWADLTPPQRALVRRLLPGPYTVLLAASREARRRLAPGVVGPAGTVGIRIPDHPVARALARAAEAIISTSVNRHGAAPARTIRSARGIFGSEVAVYLDAAPAPAGRPSVLVDLRGPRPVFTARS